MSASLSVMPGNSALLPGCQYQPKGMLLSLHCSGKRRDSSIKSRSTVRLLVV